MEPFNLSPQDFIVYQCHKAEEQLCREQAAKLLRRAAIEEQLAELVLRSAEITLDK